jgi:hypothetical protein
MTAALSIDCASILSELDGVAFDSQAYSEFVKANNLSDQNIKDLVEYWLTSDTIDCDNEAMALLHFQMKSDSWFNQKDMFDVAIKHNTPEIWKRVFDFASEYINSSANLRNLQSPINLFSLGLLPSNTTVWRNIFNSGHHYPNVFLQNVESDLQAWYILIDSVVDDDQALFDLCLYTNCHKSILRRIHLIKSGVFMFDTLKTLGTPSQLNMIISTGYVWWHTNDMLAYGEEQNIVATWSAILTSKAIKDVETIDEILHKFPECAITAIKAKLSEDLSVLISWGMKDQKAFSYLSDIYLKKDNFPLQLKVVKL